MFGHVLRMEPEAPTQKGSDFEFAVIGSNRVRRQSGFPTFISCQRQDPNVLPKQRQSHQGDKLCDVSTVPLVARWPVFLARGSDADSEPHSTKEDVAAIAPTFWS